MMYDLSNSLDAQCFSTRATFLCEKRAVVELTEKAPKTLPQNNYAHLIMGVLAMETGNTLEFVKREYFKKLCNYELFVTKEVDPYLGVVEKVKSFKDPSITKEKMSEAIDRFRNWAASEGYYIPDPEDKENLRKIEVEMDRQKKWL